MTYRSFLNTRAGTLAALGIAATLVTGIFYKVVRVRAQSVVPSTATLTEFVSTKSGVMVEGPTYTFATRSDGSTLLMSGASPHAPKDEQRILYFASGERVYVVDSRKVRMSTFNPRYSVSSALRFPESNCMRPKDQP